MKIYNLKRKINTNNIQVDNKKYYFNDNDIRFYEKNIITNENKLIVDDQFMENSILLFNDKLYISSLNKKVYEYNLKTMKLKTIIESNNAFLSCGTVLNNKIYFVDHGGKIYEYNPYLSLELIESNIINLQELIERGIFLYFQEQNPNFYIQNKNIEFNMNNLMYSDIELIKKEFVSNIKNVENVCDGTATFNNESSSEEEYQTQICNYTKQNIESYQILKGLNKIIDNTSEKGTIKTNTSSILNTNSKSSISQTGVEVSAGGSLFGINLGASISHSEGKEESSTSQNENSNSKTENISQIVTNYSSIDLSSVNEIQKTETRSIELPSQKVKVSGNQTKKLTFTLNKIITKNKLTFNQKINGKIKVKIIDEHNNIIQQDLSIENIMFVLKNNDLLPKEIIINNSDISFQGSFLFNQFYTSNLDIKTEEIDKI